MKALFLAGILLLFAANVFATSFCIQVQDQCCDGTPTSGTVNTGINDNFENYYVYINTGSATDEATVTVSVDGVDIFTRSACGCQDPILITHHTVGAHTIKALVDCHKCPDHTGCVSGTAIVRVYTPVGNACSALCQGL